jgi:hypothetical protein
LARLHFRKFRAFFGILGQHLVGPRDTKHYALGVGVLGSEIVLAKVRVSSARLRQNSGVSIGSGIRVLIVVRNNGLIA